MTLDSPQSAARPFDAPMIVVASHNAGKVKEIGALLAPFKVVAQSAAALDLIEPEETGSSFIENAILKAKAAAMEAELPALADDSGLAVTALNGEPGIYSARWAGPDRDFGRAMERINTELGDQADRSATFVCALALCWPDEHVEVFEGTVEGDLVWPPRGSNGFGYDPIFVPKGHSLTFGEMAPEDKHPISHRAAAFELLTRACFQAL